MKKRILLFGLLVLTVATLIFAFAFTTSAESNQAPTVSVDKFNLVFSDNVYLKYAVKFSGVSDSAISEETVGMLFFTKVCDEYVAGKEDASSSLIGYTTISGVKYYTFEYRGVTAKRMTEDVYCVAYIDYNGERYYSEPVKYSVLEYAYTILGKLDVAANKDENYKKLITATIEQGAAAQKYFGYKANRLANASYYQIKVVGGTLEDGFDKGLYLTTETATPAPFTTVIKCTGNVIGATGDVMTIVAPQSGTVHYNRAWADGSAVSAGSALFSISSRNVGSGDAAERARISYETACPKVGKRQYYLATRI